ncbi:MAG: glycosyltransferase family 4 protein [Gemmatimonadaceae bacterium]
MRILFFTASRSWTGNERVFAATARGLSQRGHTVTYACAADSLIERRLDHTSYEILPIASGSFLFQVLRLRRALEGRFIEAILVSSERDHVVAALAARIAERATIIRRIPHEQPLQDGRRERIAMRLAHSSLLFASDYERRQTPGPFRPVETTVVSLGVDVREHDAQRAAGSTALGVPEGSRLIVCVHDIGSRARAATVLRVVAMLAPLHADLRLALIGPGSDSQDLRMHAAALRIAGIVSFLGEREDYLQCLRAADLGWVVASGDSAAFAVLDFSALRVPLVLDRSLLAQQYMADGITGVLLAPGDTSDNAAAVARLLAHDDERSAMGNAARARVDREFEEGAMIDGFERSIVSAGKRSRWVGGKAASAPAVGAEVETV